ncbi:MAG TPA: HAMP domain-containing sensor histidine kinase [Desulfosarcina sp.]|nr:HAMP domain-containing sensor histidine kinase [Desulfosarcina sp.]
MRLTIFQRLTAGYLVILLMVSVFGGYVAFQLNRLTRITHLAAGTDSQIIQTLESLAARLETLVSLEKKYWISRDREFYRLFLKRRDEFLGQLNGLAQPMSPAPAAALLNKTLVLSRSYFEGVEQRASRADLSAPAGYASERDQVTGAVAIALRQIRLAADQTRDGRIRQSESISATVLHMTIVLAAACIVAGLAISLLTTHRIVYPIVVLQRKTRDIAAGRFVKVDRMRAPPEIRHLAEEFNAMSEKLAELDRLKEDFVSHMSHTLRTPLTAIQEASQMLLKGTFDQEPESRSQLLSIVHDACGRMIVAVNRILDLARMESGMMDYRFAPANLNDLIQSAVFNLSPLAQAKGIRLYVEPHPDLPPVLVDADQLYQLLENLIGNALKFTESGGRVTIKTLTPAAGNGNVRVSIADTGCGVDPAFIETIFEKFRSIESGRKTTRGTGLGLAIARHIVAAHGGSIWVESAKGKGSTFYFSLPPA